MSRDAGIVVPPERLPRETLLAVVDAYVLREGTDYGHRDVALEDKRVAVLRQIERGEVVLVFDPRAQDVDLVLARELPPHLREGG
jgi:uncharacterized protein YheU (UPF0270 family)